jgi:hypothetical protein
MFGPNTAVHKILAVHVAERIQPGPTRTSDRIRSATGPTGLSSSSLRCAPLPPGTLPHLPHIYMASPPPAPAAVRPHRVFVYGTLMVEEVVRVLLGRAPRSSPTTRGSASTERCTRLVLSHSQLFVNPYSQPGIWRAVVAE